MGFGFDQNTKDTGSALFIAGINKHPKFPELQNVDTFIDNIEYCPKEEGSILEANLKISMRDSEGRTLEHRYFDPTTGQYAGDKSVERFNKVMRNLTTKFLGEEYVVPTQPSFEAYCKRIISDLGTAYKNVPLRTKVLLNAKNFPKLPSYAPIWELASVAPEDSRLKINPNWNDVVVPVAMGASSTSGAPAIPMADFDSVFNENLDTTV